MWIYWSNRGSIRALNASSLEEEDANGAIRQDACSVEATFRALRAACVLSSL